MEQKHWINDFLETTPPSELYHYTNQDGLHGIVTTKEFWATSAGFLNDASEFKHGKDIAQEEIGKMLASERDPKLREALMQLLDAVKFSGSNVYVLSWSATRDDLSQWRAYGGPQTGYQIGVTGEDLRDIATRNNFTLVRCLYRDSEKREKMKELIERVLVENTTEGPSTLEDLEGEMPGGDMGYYINRCACMFKDLAFEREEEWRLISRPTSLRNKGSDVRSCGRSTLVPFYRLRVDPDEREPVPINSVLVGPCPHEGNAVAGVRALLYRHNGGIGAKTVASSRIPYRNW